MIISQAPPGTNVEVPFSDDDDSAERFRMEVRSENGPIVAMLVCEYSFGLIAT